MIIRYGQKGAITVFLSLISVLLLSLVCTLVESARVQGAQAVAAAAVDVGLFDLFGEYEKTLLAEYDVFFVDGAYGTGEFEIDRVNQRVQEWTSYNLSPYKGIEADRSFQMYPIQIEEGNITGYALATDDRGSIFYQQVVTNLKENLGSKAVQKIMKNDHEAKKQEEDGKAYEENDKQNIESMKELNEIQAAGEIENREAEGDTENQNSVDVLENQNSEKVENPLEILKQMKEMGILELVVKNTDDISVKEIEKAVMPSGRSIAAGNMEIKKEQNGVIADGLFQEYLVGCFSNAVDKINSGSLDYQLEYILMGKESDRENLKAIVNRLLLMREGANFLYSMGNADMREQALILATTLTGALAVPGLAAVTQMALLLAWAYGESLLDVRTLLAGGKVPFVKTADSWKLSLDNLGNLTEILEECDQGGGQGQDYVDYLRLLLCLCGKDNYPMRALDMVEGNLREKKETAGFRADACVAKIEAEVSFRIAPVFLCVPGGFLGIENRSIRYNVYGRFGY